MLFGYLSGGLKPATVLCVLDTTGHGPLGSPVGGVVGKVRKTVAVWAPLVNVVRMYVSLLTVASLMRLLVSQFSQLSCIRWVGQLYDSIWVGFVVLI